MQQRKAHPEHLSLIFGFTIGLWKVYKVLASSSPEMNSRARLMDSVWRGPSRDLPPECGGKDATNTDIARYNELARINQLAKLKLLSLWSHPLCKSSRFSRSSCPSMSHFLVGVGWGKL